MAAAALSMRAALSSVVASTNASRSSFAGSRIVNAKATNGAKVSMVGAKGSWLPGSTAPAYLDGSLPGDVGFDPLGLGEDPESLAWYVKAELVHARFAMLGLVGVVTPELLTNTGYLDLPLWFDAGAVKFSWADAGSLFFVQLILMGWAEMRRYYDSPIPGSEGDNTVYPGGIFDPLGFAKYDETRLYDLKTKEIANGRLAMVAMAGVYAQAKTTGVGPVANLTAHLADPWHTTVVTLEPARFFGN